ncbi:MAG: sulfatase-like hydrolase/transferase [Bryobacterales bacterium]|nr:sulfatase-like hydrolase/transferase [Bryobacterales bacterium]
MLRRDFLSAAGLSLAAGDQRPNILWLTCEDTGPQLGCYGDPYATTPNLDGFAKRSLRYDHAWSNAPVCAPARTTIISGMYPPSTGAEHMRSMTRLPQAMRMFPCYLRDAGYYCTNNVKEDYNLAHTGTVWDDSSNKAHYRNRRSDQPFFAVFNNVITHESQIRKRPHTLQHDPAGVRVPAYHPDTPEVRHDWAQYYDNITTMDKWFGQQLQDLERAGLSDNTVVFFYGDHGSGMPRSKRWPYNSGLQVPLLVHIPERFRAVAPKDYAPGRSTKRLVSFVDLAPTVLSLAGLRAQPFHQGHAFLGQHAAPEQKYVYGFRGRMDERYDMVRSLRDQRYVYIRNYMPHRIYGQHVSYMFETPTTQVWKRLNDEGKLDPVQRTFWKTKPPEELYDLEQDRDETKNLASDPARQAIVQRMRAAQQELAASIRDVGFLPEGEIHQRAGDAAPYEAGHDPARYPCQRVQSTAAYATGPATNTQPLLSALKDRDSAVRYWAATGLLIRSDVAALRSAIKTDSSPYVKIVAAECLGKHGSPAEKRQAIDTLLTLAPADKNEMFVSLAALNVLEMLPLEGQDRQAILAMAHDDTKVDKRFQGYIPRMLERFKS